jgi:hypothetical protein
MMPHCLGRLTQFVPVLLITMHFSSSAVAQLKPDFSGTWETSRTVGADHYRAGWPGVHRHDRGRTQKYGDVHLPAGWP